MNNKIEDFSSYCQVVGKTDVGRKRAANEDFLGQAVTPNGLAAVVCDGMGGHVGGATASHIAVETVIEYLQLNYREDPRMAISEAIDAANNAILSHASVHPELQGMGSTCVLLLVRNGYVYIGHVGDSRIYLVRQRTIRQLTKDHSYVQMLVDAGQISKEEAEHHPRKNEITNALGIPNMQPATVLDDAINPEAGDCFLLCSDGLSGMVSDHDIEKIISRQREMRAQERADRLIEMACENGGLDNVTVELVEFSVTPGAKAASHAMSAPAVKKPVLLGAIAAVVLCLVGAGVWWWSSQRSDQNKQMELLTAGTSLNVFEKKIGDIILPNLSGTILIMTMDSTGTCIATADGQQLWHEGLVFNQDSVKVTPKDVIRPIHTAENMVEVMTQPGKTLSEGQNIAVSLQNEEQMYVFTLVVRTKEAPKKPEAQPQKPQQPNTDIFKNARPVNNSDGGTDQNVNTEESTADPSPESDEKGDRPKPVTKQDNGANGSTNESKGNGNTEEKPDSTQTQRKPAIPRDTTATALTNVTNV